MKREDGQKTRSANDKREKGEREGVELRKRKLKKKNSRGVVELREADKNKLQIQFQNAIMHVRVAAILLQKLVLFRLGLGL